MSAVYYSLITDDLLPEIRSGENLPAGLRLLRELGSAGPDRPGQSWVEFEDDGADPAYMHLVVTPTVHRSFPDGPTWVVRRDVERVIYVEA